MDLQPTELQELLRTSAQDFLAREAPSDRIREVEAAGEPDAALWSGLVELGWPALPIDEAYGGQGASLLDLAVVIEELCRAAVLSPYQQTMLAALAVQRAGNDEVRSAFLPRIASEGVSVSLALLEGSGDVYGSPTASVDGETVSGEKRFVEYAAATDYHLVAATRGGVPGLAIVPAGQEGVRIVDSLPSIGKTPQSVVRYERAGIEGWVDGAAAVDTLRELGAAFAAFETYAYSQHTLDQTVAYVQLRVQFGRPIGSFQAVQLRCADMATQVQAARFLTRELLWQLDHGEADLDQIAVVKAATARTQSYVAQEAHVLHGGIGYITEYDLYFDTIRGKEAALRFGSSREALDRVAAGLLDESR